MNYFRQLRAFRIRKKLCQLAAPEIALWFALMNISNELGQYDRLSLSVSTLMEEAGLSRGSFIRARNSLKQHGLISWDSRKGNQSALYTMIDLSAVFQYGTQTDTQSGTQTDTQSGTQTDTIYKLNVTDLNKVKKTYYNSAWRTSARARAAVAQNLIDGWEAIRGNSTALTGIDANRILCDYLEAGMTPEQIQVVLQECMMPWCVENYLFTEAVHLGVVTEESYLCPNAR
jgi:hypothetical protein